MVARSVVAVCVTAVLATLGCSADAADSDDDGAETGSALASMPLDDRPAPWPLDHPVPAKLHAIRGPAFDLRRFFEDLERRRFDVKPCYQYELEIYDPARGRNIRVPVTVCD